MLDRRLDAQKKVQLGTELFSSTRQLLKGRSLTNSRLNSLPIESLKVVLNLCHDDSFFVQPYCMLAALD